jgi:hypothetical protein
MPTYVDLGTPYPLPSSLSNIICSPHRILKGPSQMDRGMVYAQFGISKPILHPLVLLQSSNYPKSYGVRSSLWLKKMLIRGCDRKLMPPNDFNWTREPLGTIYRAEQSHIHEKMVNMHSLRLQNESYFDVGTPVPTSRYVRWFRYVRRTTVRLDLVNGRGLTLTCQIS